MFVLEVAVPTPLSKNSFDYLPLAETVLEDYPPGIRILVPFGKRQLIGIVLSCKKHSEFEPQKLKTILKKIDETPLIPDDIFRLSQWASNYYHYSLGNILTASLPSLLRQGKPFANIYNYLAKHPEYSSAAENFTPQAEPELTAEQQLAVTQISSQENIFKVFLLYGITGSGKTEVYLQLIKLKLAQAQQVLIIVPEISLTPQTLARFQSRFNTPIALLHSKLSPNARAANWLLARDNIAPIVIGTRSAIFTNLPKLGLIIIDEEHDQSFKQQDSLRYSARDLGIVRAQQRNIPIILGSATPSLETLYNVEQQRYTQLTLSQRPANSQLPLIQLVNAKNQTMEACFHPTTLAKIKEHLSRQQQVLIFLNRRGYAPILLCHNCGWIAKCPDCEIAFTLHRQYNRLICHHCGYSREIFNSCQECKQGKLQILGLGTEQLAEILDQLFPEYSKIRIDSDTTTKKGSLEEKLSDIHAKRVQILIGTQMLAKGHHFPDVSLVVLLEIDAGLFSPDFRAAERMGQLLIQVAGRAGRAEVPGEVIVQTYHPQHPLLLTLIKQDYLAFARQILHLRQLMGLPPFQHLALIRAEAKQLKNAQKFLFDLKNKISTAANAYQINLHGPIPSHQEKHRGKYRAILLIQGSHKSALQNFLHNCWEEIQACKKTGGVNWILDIDPLEVN